MALGSGLPGFIKNTELGAAVFEKVTSQAALEILIAGSTGFTFSAAEIANLHLLDPKSRDPIIKFILDLIGQGEIEIGRPIFQALVQTSLGLNLSDKNGQAAQAISQIERAIGFAAAPNLVLAPIAGILDAHFGTHAPKKMVDLLSQLPHEVGMSFFLGTTLASIFETATMSPLREAIAEQTHPLRLEPSVILRLLRAHKMPTNVAQDYLNKAGYRQQDIPYLLASGDAALGIAEIEQAWIHGRLSDDETTTYLDSLGLTLKDINLLKQQWAENAQAEGASLLRGEIHRGLIEGHIDDATGEAMLRSISVPEQALRLEMAAVRLEREWGRLSLSVGDIKALFQKGETSDVQAQGDLVTNGYTIDAAQSLVKLWVSEQKPAKVGLGVSKILSYLMAGVIDKPAALELLLAMNISPEAATLLITNPNEQGGIYRFKLDEKAYVSAYLDEVITVDALRAGLTALKIDPARVDLVVRTAVAKFVKGQKPKKPPKPLSEAQVLDAVKYGLATPAWAIRELVILGYSDADAHLIVGIEVTKLTGNVPDNWTVLA